MVVLDAALAREAESRKHSQVLEQEILICNAYEENRLASGKKVAPERRCSEIYREAIKYGGQPMRSCHVSLL
jgi:hypothetical protein